MRMGQQWGAGDLRWRPSQSGRRAVRDRGSFNLAEERDLGGAQAFKGNGERCLAINSSERFVSGIEGVERAVAHAAFRRRARADLSIRKRQIAQRRRVAALVRCFLKRGWGGAVARSKIVMNCQWESLGSGSRDYFGIRQTFSVDTLVTEVPWRLKANWVGSMSKKTKVWTSEAWANTRYIKRVSFDERAHNVEVAKRFERGLHIDPDWFPKSVFWDHAGANLGHISLIKNGLVLISDRLTDLISGFDIGKNQLVETKVCDPSNKNESKERFFFLNIIEKKDGCFVLEESKGPFIGNSEQGYIATGFGYDGIAVRGAKARDGVDLWMDPLLDCTPFFSGPLGEAIKNGKFGRTGLKPCVVLPD